MVNKIDYEKLNNVQCYCQWATFKAIPGALGTDRGKAITQAQEFFAALEAEGNVTVRGIYDITGGRAEADHQGGVRLLELQRRLQPFPPRPYPRPILRSVLAWQRPSPAQRIQ